MGRSSRAGVVIKQCKIVLQLATIATLTDRRVRGLLHPRLGSFSNNGQNSP